MTTKITSSDNRIIKNSRLLNKRKNREKNKEYILEGIRSLKDAITYKEDIKYILYSQKVFNTSQGQEILDIIKKDNFKTYEVEENLLDSICDTHSNQGIMAVMSMKDYDVNNIIKKDGLYIILDKIQDPGNLGTIIRTADSAGFDGILMTKGCVDIYNPKVVRSTMGSIFNIPIIQTCDEFELIHMCKEKEIKIVCTSLNTNKYYYDIDFTKNVAIVIGNEGNGIGDTLLNSADETIKIPILGKAESLNASIASSIIIYESVRQKMTKSL